MGFLVKGLVAGSVSPEGPLYYLMQFLYVCFVLNTGLAVFNLIPISPLDGSKILAIFLPDKAHAWLMRYERYGMFLLIALLLWGKLDGPLDLLRGGLMDAVTAVARPLAQLLIGA